MLPYTLAPIQRLQSSLVPGNTLLQRVRPGVQIALAGEGRGLLQRQEHSTRGVSAKGPLSYLGHNSQQSKRGDSLDQKCLFGGNGSRVSKATAAFESIGNVRAETLRAWTFLTRSSGLRQTHHVGRHQPVRRLEVDRSSTIWLTGLVSVPSYAPGDIAKIPREKPVKPTCTFRSQYDFFDTEKSVCKTRLESIVRIRSRSMSKTSTTVETVKVLRKNRTYDHCGECDEGVDVACNSISSPGF